VHDHTEPRSERGTGGKGRRRRRRTLSHTRTHAHTARTHRWAKSESLKPFKQCLSELKGANKAKSFGNAVKEVPPPHLREGLRQRGGA
jgi:hypothetical protein